MSVNLAIIQQEIASGSQKALKMLYDELGDKLLELAIAIVSSRELAEEIVEDVFMKIWKKRERFGNISDPKWYLYVTTRNISLNYLKKYRRFSWLDVEEINTPQLTVDATPEDLMITSEVMNKINGAINDLPPQCRLIFKLVKEDGLKYREAAVLLNISEKTVENQIGIALKKLHAALDIRLHPAKIPTPRQS